jgi:hypothetical protein
MTIIVGRLATNEQSNLRIVSIGKRGRLCWNIFAIAELRTPDRANQYTPPAGLPPGIGTAPGGEPSVKLLRHCSN